DPAAFLGGDRSHLDGGDALLRSAIVGWRRPGWLCRRLRLRGLFRRRLLLAFLSGDPLSALLPWLLLLAVEHRSGVLGPGLAGLVGLRFRGLLALLLRSGRGFALRRLGSLTFGCRRPFGGLGSLLARRLLSRGL